MNADCRMDGIDSFRQCQRSRKVGQTDGDAQGMTDLAGRHVVQYFVLTFCQIAQMDITV